jgi:hypothetical protein
MGVGRAVLEAGGRAGKAGGVIRSSARKIVVDDGLARDADDATVGQHVVADLAVRGGAVLELAGLVDLEQVGHRRDLHDIDRRKSGAFGARRAQRR